MEPSQRSARRTSAVRSAREPQLCCRRHRSVDELWHPKRTAGFCKHLCWLRCCKLPSGRRAKFSIRGIPGKPRPNLYGFKYSQDWNDRFANATTARGTVSHILLRSDSAQSRLHFSFGQGITNPSFFELFGFAPATFIGNPDLKPEQSNSFDLGWSQSFAANIAGQDTRWNVDVTYFAADLQNEITTIYDSNFMSTPINLETDSKRSGVEVSADANFGENWQLGAAYTRLRARENRIEEVRRPRHSGQIRLSRNFANNRGRASIQFLHNGRRTDSEFIYATPETRVDLQPYTLTNVGVSSNCNPT